MYYAQMAAFLLEVTDIERQRFVRFDIALTVIFFVDMGISCTRHYSNLVEYQVGIFSLDLLTSLPFYWMFTAPNN